MFDSVYILGSNRSGSTLIGCILGSQQNVFENFHVGELHSLYKENSSINSDFWNNIDYKNYTYKNIYTRIHDITKCNVIIDSSKRYDRYLDIKSYNPTIILTYKPFNKLLQSFKERNLTEKHLYNQLKKYKYFLENENIKYHIVNIEDIIKNPAEYTKKLCNICNIPYFKGKERYWNFNTYNIGGSPTQQKHYSNPKEGKFILNKLESINIDSDILNKKEFIELENRMIQESI